MEKDYTIKEIENIFNNIDAIEQKYFIELFNEDITSSDDNIFSWFSHDSQMLHELLFRAGIVDHF